MELTQRIECTQELYPNNTEKDFPEQIGFLGICGKKYPLKKGPNKIGRDPDTCNIVLNLDSISRQHAVINILSSHEYMLMDLDSANKTKLSDKTLQPYIPHPLKNGDMVQFGKIFGVFRLIEEENDLPMTQAIDVPETPVHNRYMSKVNKHGTTIPESPDVSDRDDSFIVPSQPKLKNVFKSPNDNFIKSSSKTVSIKPVGLNKIDNIYWNSSKKSDSFQLQSNSSINDVSVASDNITKENIHELETQVINTNNDSMCNDSIYNADTQLVGLSSPSIHNVETQIPKDLPEVCKVQNQQNLHMNFTIENKENDNNIFNAETQIVLGVKQSMTENFINNDVHNQSSKENFKVNNNVSDDEILFDEIDAQDFENDFESQEILPPEFVLNNVNQDVSKDIKQSQDEIKGVTKHTKRAHRLNSDSSTDCEDDIYIAMTQKISNIRRNDDDSTDCEDEPLAISKSKEKQTLKVPDIDDDVTDCEDNLEDKSFIQSNTNNVQEKNKNTQKNDTKISKNNSKDDKGQINFEDIATQVIAEDRNNCNETINFEDLPTQVLAEEPIFSQDIVTPFKMPRTLSTKKKPQQTPESKVVENFFQKDIAKLNDSDSIGEKNYYAATQQLYNDLCSQRQSSPEMIRNPTKNSTAFEKTNVSATSNTSGDHYNDDIDIEKKIDNFVHNLTNSQIRDVIGVKKTISDTKNDAIPNKISQNTHLNKKEPKKNEIKSSVSLNNTRDFDLSSKLEARNCSLPIKNRRTKKGATKTKVDVHIVPESETVSTRIITRIRRPTTKILNYQETEKHFDDYESKNMEKDENKSRKSKSNKSKTKEIDKIKLDSTSKDKSQIKTDKNVSKKAEQTKSINEKYTKDIIYYMKNNDTNRSTRSRSNKGLDDEEKTKTKDKFDETKSTAKKNKSRKTKDKSPQKVIRRSERQRSSQKSESQNADSKSKHTKDHEKSAIYNVSSDSSMDGNKLKRPATMDFDIPNAKKTRSGMNFNNSARATPARGAKAHYVLFTAFPCEEVKAKLEKLGAILVTDVMRSTVVLTMQIKRTFKLLCAVGLGKPIVGPPWVQACVDTNTIVDPWLYLIQDGETEKRFQFNLARSLSAKRGFLKGYNISSTPNVMPNEIEMKSIVECSGGTWKGQGPNWICVSVTSDKALWPALRKKGAIIVSTEFILAGVLQQRVEIEANKLV